WPAVSTSRSWRWTAATGSSCVTTRSTPPKASRSPRWIRRRPRCRSRATPPTSFATRCCASRTRIAPRSWASARRPPWPCAARTTRPSPRPASRRLRPTPRHPTRRRIPDAHPQPSHHPVPALTMSIDLRTSYLGLKLKNPLMPGASPLVDSLDQVKRLEDAGAAAVVMHSLFAEQIERDGQAWDRHAVRWENSFAEAESFLPQAAGFSLGPDEYLARVARLKEVCSVPVIASLNGTRVGEWVGHAALIEQAGADALELNTYFLATDTEESGESLEERLLEVVRGVRERVDIPIAVKLSPYHTSVGHLVRRLEAVGAEGV